MRWNTYRTVGMVMGVIAAVLIIHSMVLGVLEIFFNWFCLQFLKLGSKWKRKNFHASINSIKKLWSSLFKRTMETTSFFLISCLCVYNEIDGLGKPTPLKPGNCLIPRPSSILFSTSFQEAIEVSGIIITAIHSILI